MKIPDESLWTEVRPKKNAHLRRPELLHRRQRQGPSHPLIAGPTCRDKSRRSQPLSCYQHHPTHWLLFLIFSAEPNPADNGYQVYGWRKSVYPTDDLLAEACARAFEGTPVQRHRTEVVTHPSIS